MYGYGSTGFDLDVLGYYAELSASQFLWTESYSGAYYESLNENDSIGLPSHSLLLGAWVDAGFLASIVWFFVLALAFYVLGRATIWNNPNEPLFVFVAITTIWDVLFSPGPDRVDMSIRLMILVFAVEFMRSFDGLATPTPLSALRIKTQTRTQPPAGRM
jgi:hypothetical protein